MKKPINEMGVVSLFSQYAQGLGYVILEIQAPFPDATLYDIETGEIIYAELEFEARNFKYHGHDPEGCELIICWEDNWPSSPLPVLALKGIHEQEAAQTIYELQKEIHELEHKRDEMLLKREHYLTSERHRLIDQLKAADAEIIALRKALRELEGGTPGLGWGEAITVFRCLECKKPLAPVAVEDGRTVVLFQDGSHTLKNGTLRCECGATREFHSVPAEAAGLRS